MAIARYAGVVCNGKIELTEPIQLPEGTGVYVLVPGVVDKEAARRKANGWLIDHVGNMVMAGQGILTDIDGKSVWRFEAFVTGSTHAPLGPIGQVLIDATSGDILSNQHTAQAMIEHGRHLKRPVLSTTG
jgi:hypothetical protein